MVFVMTYLTLTNRCPFRTFLVSETGQKLDSAKSREHGRCSKAAALYLARYFAFRN
jgi:hypothetical protein